MKRISFLGIALCAILSFSSCEKEKFVNEKEEALFSFVINASTEGAGEPSTKVVLGPTTGEGETKMTTVLWAEGDDIICTKQGDNRDDGYEHKITAISAGVGSTSASFEFKLPANYIIDYIIHPARICSDKVNNDEIVFKRPFLDSYQKYRENGIDPSCIPMIYVNPSTTENPSEAISFRNICGVVKLSLQSTHKNLVVKRIILKSPDVTNGYFTADIDENRNFNNLDNLIKLDNFPTGPIQLSCGEDGVSLGAEAKDFYIVVPPTQTAGFEVEIYTSEGYMTIAAPDKDVNKIRRNMIKSMPTIDLKEHAFTKMWENNAASSFAGGTGSIEDPYQISTPEELALLSKDSKKYPKNIYFKLTSDIILSSSTDAEKDKYQWTPISNFLGVFDGNGKSITYNYDISTLPGEKSGAFSLFNFNMGIIKNLVVKGKIKGSSLLAGIVKFNGGTIINCINAVDIEGDYDLAGIAYLNSGYIINSANIGTIKANNTGENKASGISYWNNASDTPNQVQNCYNYGTITNGTAFGEFYSKVPPVGLYYLEGSATSAAYNTSISSSILSKTSEEFKSLASILNTNAGNYNSQSPIPSEKACKWIDGSLGYPELDFGTVAEPKPEPVVEYVDEYGINRGLGIKIGETIWAPVNCGYQPAGEVEAEHKGYPYGKLYQWGRKDGQGYNSDDAISTKVENQKPSTFADAKADTFYQSWDNLIAPDGSWGGSDGKTRTDNDPCPEGWRVPTKAELEFLMGGAEGEIGWDTEKKGYWLNGTSNPIKADNAKSVFLPAAGIHLPSIGYAFNRYNFGGYWSSSVEDVNACSLNFSHYDNTDIISVSSGGRAAGFSVRCVAE